MRNNKLRRFKDDVEDRVREAISELSDDEKVQLWNEYVREYMNGERELHYFDDEFFNTYFEGNPTEAVRAAFFGDIRNWNDEYIYFNGYGNLETTDNPDDVMDISELADNIAGGDTQYLSLPESVQAALGDDSEDDEGYD